jgi:hypothetical protein
MFPHQDMIYTIPAELNEGEQTFIRNLRDYLKVNTKILENKQLYVLRNLTKGRGIGFFEVDRFYPDFIMWIIDKYTQWITFIDPKGLIFLDYEDPKLHLHEYLKEQVQPKLVGQDIRLDAFIISDTSYDQFRKRHAHPHRSIEDCEKNHILFQYKTEMVPDKLHIGKLLNMIVGGRENC